MIEQQVSDEIDCWFTMYVINTQSLSESSKMTLDRPLPWTSPIQIEIFVWIISYNSQFNFSLRKFRKCWWSAFSIYFGWSLLFVCLWSFIFFKLQFLEFFRSLVLETLFSCAMSFTCFNILLPKKCTTFFFNLFSLY